MASRTASDRKTAKTNATTRGDATVQTGRVWPASDAHWSRLPPVQTAEEAANRTQWTGLIALTPRKGGRGWSEKSHCHARSAKHAYCVLDHVRTEHYAHTLCTGPCTHRTLCTHIMHCTTHAQSTMHTHYALHHACTEHYAHTLCTAPRTHRTLRMHITFAYLLH